MELYSANNVGVIRYPYQNFKKAEWRHFFDPGYCRWRSPWVTCCEYMTFWHALNAQENPLVKKRISSDDTPFQQIWLAGYGFDTNKLRVTETTFICRRYSDICRSINDKGSGPTNRSFIDLHVCRVLEQFSVRVRSSRTLDEGRGARSPKRFFRPFGPQFSLKIRGPLP